MYHQHAVALLNPAAPPQSTPAGAGVVSGGIADTFSAMACSCQAPQHAYRTVCWAGCQMRLAPSLVYK